MSGPKDKIIPTDEPRLVAAQLEALAVERYPILETEKFHSEAALVRGSLRSGFKEGYAALLSERTASEAALKENERLRARVAELVKALEALRFQALQSDVNSPSNEWGREALEGANAALTPTPADPSD